MPPLRERRGDIPRLIHYFLGQAKREFNKQDLEGASPETADLLTSYTWPGNVRQLRAVVRRCVLESILPVIVPDVLPREIREGEVSEGAGDSNAILPIEPHRAGSADQRSDQDGGANEIDQSGRELPDLVDRLLDDNATDLYAEGVAYAERYLLLRVLRETEGNQSRAAEILGITRGKLRDRIATYNIKLESGVKIGE